MGMDLNIKKKVIEDWQKAFPQLSIFGQNKLYKILGPVILGLELIKLPGVEKYSPYFVMYSLWKENIKISLEYPILLKGFYDKKGFQYDVPYEGYSFFKELVKSVENQSPFTFDGDIDLEKIFLVINEYSKTPPLSAAPYSYLQADLKKAKFEIAMYISASEAKKVLQEIEKTTWDVNHFKACGIDLELWLQDLQEKVHNRDGFLSTIEKNKQKKKICKLKKSEIVA
jgi:hypothetical protein